MKNFEVYENNGGGIALLVYGRDGEIEYIHTGYEYWPGQLSQDLRALQGGDDPATDWDGNEIDDFAQDNWSCLTADIWGGPWGDLIADNWGTYPHNMGAAARREFYPDTDDD